MVAVCLWLSAAAACAMLFARSTRNPGLIALVGTMLGLLYHYDIATVPEVSYLAMLFWAGAAALLVARIVAQRHRRTA